MVFLGISLWAISQATQRAAKRAGIAHLLKYTVCESSRKKSHKRVPAPGWKKAYRSVLLGRKISLRVTTASQKAIDAAGGFDRYVYYTPAEELNSTLGVILKRRMNALIEKYPSIEPPPLDKRNPKPLPKKLPIKVPKLEGASMRRYMYLS